MRVKNIGVYELIKKYGYLKQKALHTRRRSTIVFQNLKRVLISLSANLFILKDVDNLKQDKKNNGLFFLASISLVLFGAVNVILAFCLKITVDAAIAKDLAAFGEALLLTLCTAVLDFGMGVLSRLALQQYVKRRLVQAKARRFEQFLRDAAGDETDIAAFSTDVDLLYANNYLNKGMLVYYFAQFILSVTSIVILSWKVSIVVLLTMFMPLIVPLIMQKRLQKSTASYTEGMNGYLSFVQDVMNGVQEIRTYGVFKFFSNSHRKLNNQAETLRLKNKLLIYLSNIISTFISTLSFIATIAICGYLTITGEVTMGTLIAVIQLINSIVGPVGNISSAVGEISATKVLASKYETFSEMAAEAGARPSAVSRIEVENLSYSYREQQYVLKDINLIFERGKKYAVLGESGSGKSTLAKLLAGLLDGYSGNITLFDPDGNSIHRTPPDRLVQYVAQEPYLFKLSAIDNVYFGDKENEESMITRMGRLGISDLFNDPSALLSNRDRISGGQKQRLVIARALYHNPDVLILDEPTANLDYETSINTINYVSDSDCGILIVITHNADAQFLNQFDEVITLAEGTAVPKGGLN